MDGRQKEVAQHYAAFGQREPILAALKKRGLDPAAVTPDDLAPFDQFHTGGAPATRATADLLAPAPGDHILDVGSGLGGPARMLAKIKRCRVTGLDLAPHFVENAVFFTGLTRQQDRVVFHQGSATALPFADASFDGAWHLHMCMNVADKAAMYAEIFRVLKPGARFALHDPFRGAAGEMAFPVPWAERPEMSFLWTPGEMRKGLAAAGFSVISEHDATEEGLAHYAVLDAARRSSSPDKPAAARPPTPLETMSKNHRANLASGAVIILSALAQKPCS